MGKMRRFERLSLGAACFFLLAGCTLPRLIEPTKAGVGYLEGRVNIGPLAPVERADQPPPTPPPEIFAGRTIDIFQPDGATLVTKAPIDSTGAYRVALDPGVYVVNITHAGIERTIELPKTVTIESGRTTQLDIEIDTGIR